MSFTNTEVIYTTGFTPEGVPLIGGVWTLWDQEGFPLESSWLHVKGEDWQVDWVEAMAAAAVTGNLPVFFRQVSSFLSEKDVENMKAGITALMAKTSPEEILERKKSNAKKIAEWAAIQAQAAP